MLNQLLQRHILESPVWHALLDTINERLLGLSNSWLDEDSPTEMYRIQGAVKELIALRDEWVTTFPESIDPKGKPSKDDVKAALEQ